MADENARHRHDWDQVYATQPPWDIGRPQPPLLKLAEAGAITGRVLDSGCGTGEHTLLAASRGCRALGVDISARAIQMARAKAVERGIGARFEVGDVLDLGLLAERFDTVLDSGVFHVFADADRPRYVRSLREVVDPGGRLHLMCFNEHVPGEWGPRRVRQAELRDAFASGWEVEAIEPGAFDLAQTTGPPTVPAWVATIRRV